MYSTRIYINHDPKTYCRVHYELIFKYNRMGILVRTHVGQPVPVSIQPKI